MGRLRSWLDARTGVADVRAMLEQTDEALVSAKNDSAELRTVLEETRKENARLEGLLDGIGVADPDAGLPGNQAHGLFRAIRRSGDPDGGPRDFTDAQRREHRRQSHMAYALRDDARNLLDTIIDFVLGDDGVRPVAAEAENKALQELLDEIWDDPRNRLGQMGRQEGMLLSLLLDGERPGTCEWNETDGRLELGWLDPEQVRSVQQDSLGRDAFVLVQGEPGQDDLRYFCLDSFDPSRHEIAKVGTEDNERYRITERALDEAAQEVGPSVEVHGLVFWWAVNRYDGATRGRVELLEVLDFVDAHDEVVWATVEREKALARYIAHLIIEDASTPEEAKAKAKEMGFTSVPEGPMVLATNSKVELKFPAPDMRAQPMETLETTLGRRILSAKGMPAHWGGAASDTNLATAQAQELLPLKRLRRKQAAFLSMLERFVRVSLALRAKAGSATVPEDLEFTMSATDIGGRERQRGTEILAKLVAAVSQIVGDGMLDERAGHHVVLQCLDEAGYEIPKEMREMPEGESLRDAEKRLAAELEKQESERDPTARGDGKVEDDASAA